MKEHDHIRQIRYLCLQRAYIVPVEDPILGGTNAGFVFLDVSFSNSVCFSLYTRRLLSRPCSRAHKLRRRGFGRNPQLVVVDNFRLIWIGSRSLSLLSSVNYSCGCGAGPHPSRKIWLHLGPCASASPGHAHVPIFDIIFPARLTQIDDGTSQTPSYTDLLGASPHATALSGVDKTITASQSGHPLF